MSLNYVAELAIPLMVPSVQSSIGFVAINLEAQLSGTLALSASFSLHPPTIDFYLAALAEIQAQIDLGIQFSVPSVSFTITADLVAELELAFSLLLVLETLLAAALEMYAFTFSGLANTMGGALTAQLGTTWPDGAPTAGACQAMIFGATSPIAQTQIQAFLNGLKVGTGLVYTTKMAALLELSLVTQSATNQGRAGIQAALDAALAIKAQVTPPSLSVTAEALAKFAAYLKAHLSVAPPAISAMLKFAASLQAQFGLLIQLGLTLNRYDAQLFCYTYSGTGAGLGSAVTSALGSTWGDGTTPTNSECFAVILATTESATFDVMSAFFGGL